MSRRKRDAAAIQRDLDAIDVALDARKQDMDRRLAAFAARASARLASADRAWNLKPPTSAQLGPDPLPETAGGIIGPALAKGLAEGFAAANTAFVAGRSARTHRAQTTPVAVRITIPWEGPGFRVSIPDGARIDWMRSLPAGSIVEGVDYVWHIGEAITLRESRRPDADVRLGDGRAVEAELEGVGAEVADGEAERPALPDLGVGAEHVDVGGLFVDQLTVGRDDAQPDAMDASELARPEQQGDGEGLDGGTAPAADDQLREHLVEVEVAVRILGDALADERRGDERAGLRIHVELTLPAAGRAL